VSQPVEPEGPWASVTDTPCSPSPLRDPSSGSELFPEESESKESESEDSLDSTSQ